jgi:uncharacterized delta-60 repeat protein
MATIRLDTTFGHGGWVGPTTTGIEWLTFAQIGLVRTRSGIIVAAGTGHRSDGEHFYLTAYEPDGRLDSRFGDEGAVVSELFANGWALAVQDPAKRPVGLEREPAQMLLVGGQTNDPESANNVFALQRYDLAGRLDRRFGVDGTARLDVAALTGPADEDDEMLLAIGVQSEAGILGAGYVSKANGGRGALVRWHADGQLDTDFGGYGGAGRGRVVYPALNAPGDLWGNVPDTAFHSVALQGDDRIVVGGTYGGQLLVARFTPDGVFDSSFGENGRVILTIGFGPLGAPRILLQPDGRILLVATVGSPTGEGLDSDVTAIGLARLLPNGSLDPTFGRLVVSPPSPPGPRPLPPGLPPQPRRPATYRLGWLIQNVSDAGFEGVNDAVMLPGTHESIIGVGGTNVLAAFQGDFLMTRYLADGEVDTSSTGSQGAVETGLPEGGGYATACLLDAERGTVTAAGGISMSGQQGVGLARYLLNG